MLRGCTKHTQAKIEEMQAQAEVEGDANCSRIVWRKNCI